MRGFWNLEKGLQFGRGRFVSACGFRVYPQYEKENMIM